MSAFNVNVAPGGLGTRWLSLVAQLGIINKRLPHHPKVHLTSYSSTPIAMGAIQKAESKRPPAAFYLAIASISLVPFIAQFSAVVLGPTLPTITLRLEAPSEKAFWCATGYVVARIATTPIWGAFSEAFGRRISLLPALSLFVFAAALRSAAQNIDWLLVGRIVRLLCASSLTDISFLL
jgi:predicted MFS family arabinose efflux permease